MNSKRAFVVGKTRFQDCQCGCQIAKRLLCSLLLETRSKGVREGYVEFLFVGRQNLARVYASVSIHGLRDLERFVRGGQVLSFSLPLPISSSPLRATLFEGCFYFLYTFVEGGDLSNEFSNGFCSSFYDPGYCSDICKGPSLGVSQVCFCFAFSGLILISHIFG